MRKRNGATAALLVGIAIAGITTVVNRSQIRNVDVVQLTGSGACVGVAIMLLVWKRTS